MSKHPGMLFNTASILKSTEFCICIGLMNQKAFGVEKFKCFALAGFLSLDQFIFYN